MVTVWAFGAAVTVTVTVASFDGSPSLSETVYVKVKGLDILDPAEGVNTIVPSACGTADAIEVFTLLISSAPSLSPSFDKTLIVSELPISTDAEGASPTATGGIFVTTGATDSIWMSVTPQRHLGTRCTNDSWLEPAICCSLLISNTVSSPRLLLPLRGRYPRRVPFNNTATSVPLSIS